MVRRRINRVLNTEICARLVGLFCDYFLRDERGRGSGEVGERVT